jgi:hypothetical protein
VANPATNAWVPGGCGRVVVVDEVGGDVDDVGGAVMLVVDVVGGGKLVVDVATDEDVLDSGSVVEVDVSGTGMVELEVEVVGCVVVSSIDVVTA